MAGYLTFGQNVVSGQCYDVRRLGLQDRHLQDCQSFSSDCSHANSRRTKVSIIERNSPEQLRLHLNVFPVEIIHLFLSKTKISKKLVGFFTSSAEKTVFATFETIKNTTFVPKCQNAKDTTHYIQHLDFGVVIFMRIVPVDNKVRLHPICDYLKPSYGRIPAVDDCVVETCYNWNEIVRHSSLSKALKYIDERMEGRVNCAIRYGLQQCVEKSHWQETDVELNLVMSNLVRIRTAVNALRKFLGKSAKNEAVVENDLPLENYEKAMERSCSLLMKLDLWVRKNTVKSIKEVIEQFLCELLTLQELAHSFVQTWLQKQEKPFFANKFFSTASPFYSLFAKIVQFSDAFALTTVEGTDFLLINENIPFVTNDFGHVFYVNGSSNVFELVSICRMMEDNDYLLVLLMNNDKLLSVTRQMSCQHEKGFIVSNREPVLLGVVHPSGTNKSVLVQKSDISEFTMNCSCNNSIYSRYWICKQCKVFVQFYQNHSIYCNCGITPLGNCMLYCFNEKHGRHKTRITSRWQQTWNGHHGNHPVFHSNRDLPTSNSYLNGKENEPKTHARESNSVSTRKDFYVLLVGLAGIGKSTLINSFLNYLAFPSSQQALNETPKCLIPTKFKVFCADFTQVTVSFGNDDGNEKFTDVLNSTESTTQSCRIHSLAYQDNNYHFIDTPGLTVDNAEECLRKITEFVGQVPMIHAICLVMKPNESMLNATFEFLLRQVLSIFPKSAIQNMNFLMTNSMATFFAPGDTLNSLAAFSKKLEAEKQVNFVLRKQTIFCFDNEPFRYLCSKKLDVDYNILSEESFHHNWNKSKESMTRFFDSLLQHKPVPSKDILELKMLGNVLNELSQLRKLQNYGEIMNNLVKRAKFVFAYYHTAVLLDNLELGTFGAKFVDKIGSSTLEKAEKELKISIKTPLERDRLNRLISESSKPFKDQAPECKKYLDWLSSGKN